MKPIKLLLITIAIFMMNNAYAVQYKFIAKNNSVYTKMCVLAGNNEQAALKRALRRHKDRIAYLANTVRCNDMYMANFAQNYNANMTFDYLKKFTHKFNLDKDPEITIKDVVARAADNDSEEEVILVYVGH